MLGANFNVLGSGVLSSVELVVNEEKQVIKGLKSLFKYTTTAIITINRRAEQLQRWHKHGSMLMREDE